MTSKGRSSKQESRRLERLKKELDNQQAKLDKQKSKFNRQRKELQQNQAKLESEKKDLQQKIRKFQLKQRETLSTPRLKSPRSGSGRGTPRSLTVKTQGELKDTKQMLESAKKQVRELRKELDGANNEIRILKRQLKNAGKGAKVTNTDAKRIKQLQREISNLKKRLKIAIRDLDKQARYYQTQLRRFKEDQHKWISRQRNAANKKGVIVKYCFIDDIRKIKVYRKGKNRIRIRTRDGGEVIVRDVQIVEASEVDEIADDVIDEVVEAIQNEFTGSNSAAAKKRRRKKKRKKNSPTTDGSEDDDYEDDDEPQTMDDVKDDDFDDQITIEDHTDAIYCELMSELSNRRNDLHIMNEIYENENGAQSSFMELYEAVKQRHEEWMNRLTVDLKYDLSDELPELNEKWEDEIYKLSGVVQVFARINAENAKNIAIEEGHKRMLEYEQQRAQQKVQSSGLQAEVQNQVEYLVGARYILMKELNGRISDLSQLNDIYFHSENNSRLYSKEAQTEHLIENIKDRHSQIVNSLSELPDNEMSENLEIELPENDDQWASLIYTTNQSYINNNTEPLRMEIMKRTQELQKVLKVLQNKEPNNTMMDDLIAGLEARQDHKNVNKQISEYENESKVNEREQELRKDDESWLAIIKDLRIANEDLKNIPPIIGGYDHDPNVEIASKTKDLIMNELMQEMNQRQKDLQSIKNVQNNDELENINTNAVHRHQQLINKLHHALKALPDENAYDMEDEETPPLNAGERERMEDMLSSMESDNKEWEMQLKSATDDCRNKQSLKNRNKYYMEEMDGRIADVLKMKDLFDKTIDDGCDRQQSQQIFNSLVQSVADRHSCNEEIMIEDAQNKESNIKQKKSDTKALKEFHENDEDWRDAIFNTAQHITKLDIADAETIIDVIEDDHKSTSKISKPRRLTVEPKKPLPLLPTAINLEQEEKDDNDIWWLDLDDERCEFMNEMESVGCNNDINQSLYDMSQYMTCVLYTENEKDVITPMYIPPPEEDIHHILSTFFDGVMFSDIINYVQHQFIDQRCVKYPNAFNPYPLCNKDIYSNMSLVLSCAKSMGIELSSHDAKEWFDPQKTPQMMIELCNGLSNILLTNKLDTNLHPELARLAKNNENPEDIHRLSGHEWLQRWMNNACGVPVKNEISDDKFNEYMWNTMQSNVNSCFKDNKPIMKYDIEPQQACEYMSDHLRKELNASSNVLPQDLFTNNRLVHDLFALQMFEIESGLPQLNIQEQKEFKPFIKTRLDRQSSTNGNTVTWINSVLPEILHVNNLARDLSDGIILLKLCEKAKNGCVNWKKAKEKVRHKFDKINNCNMVMAIVNAPPFNFKANIAGTDIEAGNQMFINTLLWLLMRYQSMKALSQLNTYGGKPISDRDIIIWCNECIHDCDQVQSRPLKSLKDRQLTTCIFYIELMKAVKMDEVDLEMCDYTVKPLVSNRVPDQTPNQRLKNARYAMTLVRMFGGELFVLPEHLMMMDSKAVLSMFATIMTLAMVTKNYEEQKLTGEFEKRRQRSILIGNTNNQDLGI